VVRADVVGVIIRMDPHKRSVTIEAIDERGEAVLRRTASAARAGG
jgi:hypothetical protein